MAKMGRFLRASENREFVLCCGGLVALMPIVLVVWAVFGKDVATWVSNGATLTWMVGWLVYMWVTEP